MTIVVHPVASRTLRAYAAQPPHALLLTGEEGVGLGTIARQFAAKQLFLDVHAKNSKGEDDPAGTISVEAIRMLYEQTRAIQNKRSFILIDDADKMSHGAQNAFLKLLEEPGRNRHFILTSHVPSRLLPTILSRTERLTIPNITGEQTDEFITSLAITDDTKKKQLHFIASGLPAELVRLTNNAEYFTTRAKRVLDARHFLTGTTYEKMVVIQNYQSDRFATLQLLDSALSITRRSLSVKPQSQLVEQLEQLLNVRQKISANQSIKLQLAHFVL